METPVELGDVVRDRWNGDWFKVVGFVEWDRSYSLRKDAMVVPATENGRVDIEHDDCDYPRKVEVCRLVVEDRS